MDFIEVEIINWSKHQPRKDIKNPTWFAMSNRVLDDPKLFGMCAEQWKVFLYVLCQASQQNRATVKINVEHASFISGVKKTVVESTISRLCDVGVTRTLRECNKNVTRQTDRQTNTHTDTLAQSGDFAAFWTGYPRKSGRSRAESRYKAALRSGATHEEVCRARDNYRAHLVREQTEARYIKHGSTFMNEWRDWLDPDAGKSETFKQSQKSILEVLKEAK